MRTLTRFVAAVVGEFGFAVDAFGVQHHLQRSEHPFKKTVVRMPGPSSVQKC